MPALATVTRLDTFEKTTASGERDVVAHSLVSDLHAPAPGIFWSDLTISALVGWGAFAVAMNARSTALVVVAALVSALGLYRGLCFTHELTHLRRRSLPGFETAWNIVFGVPLLLPSFTYIGVHTSHHNLATYGTRDDPEYLPFATSRGLLVTFAIQSSVLIPVILILRFVLLSPIALVWPRFHRWLETHASSFAMNPAYRRSVNASMRRKMRVWELAMLVAWWGIGVSLYLGVLPVKALVLWCLILVFVSFVNTMRVLGAHRYESTGDPGGRHWQLVDSIDTPGRFWTELWAPVGLRYHALHHFFPGIPYHNLGAAYRRIVDAASDGRYLESTSPSLPHSLSALYGKASRSRLPAHDR